MFFGLNPQVVALVFAVGLFVGILVLQEVGRRIGGRRLARDPEGSRTGLSAVEGALFGLLGLLIAFSFSGAANRLDVRKHLINEEANAIGTAWLRIDLLPPDAQPPLRDLFRRYLDSRLQTYAKLPDLKAAEAELAHSIELQGEIWKHAVTAVKSAPPGPSGTALLTSLNQMFDIVTTRTTAARTHPPEIVYLMLAALAFAAALFAGAGMAGTKTRSWIHIFGFALAMSLTVYVILDLEFPRFGLIRVDAMDRVLVELRESMN
jgi:hypothetical protein